MERIAVIVGKMDSGGKKNLIMEYYRHIDRRKFQFDFICDSDSKAIPEEEIANLGGRIYRITPYQSIFHNMVDLYQICKKNKYKIIHAYNSTLNIFPMAVAWILGVPVRISESISMGHKYDKRTYLKRVLRVMSKTFANQYMACGVDCGIWQFGQKLYSDGKLDIFRTVINTQQNEFDTKLREITRDKYGWRDKIVIGHIGRLTIQKNPLFLLEIFNEIVKLEPNAILCLIGDGDMKADVLEYIRSLGLEKSVSYLGSREDIHQFYNAMDCFVLPSLYEGLPVVGLEAECHGLPVFFSSEVTREANACELGHFLPLDEPPKKWANEILMAIAKNRSQRRSRAVDIIKAGFDSRLEAKRLQNYYLKKIGAILKDD